MDQRFELAAVAAAFQHHATAHIEDPHVREVEPLRCEVARDGGAVPIDGIDAPDRDHIGMRASDLDERRLEDLAGLAPLRPEIEDRDLSGHRHQFDRLTRLAEVCDIETRRIGVRGLVGVRVVVIRVVIVLAVLVVMIGVVGGGGLRSTERP